MKNRHMWLPLPQPLRCSRVVSMANRTYRLTNRPMRRYNTTPNWHSHLRFHWRTSQPIWALSRLVLLC